MPTAPHQFMRWTSLSMVVCILLAAGASRAIGKAIFISGDNSSADLQPAGKGSAASDPPKAALELQADELVSKHNYLEAIRLYQSISPQSATVCNKIGIASEYMRLNVQAKAYFEQAIRMNPKFAEAENNLGTVYYMEKDYRRAERFYKKSIRLDSKGASAYENLGTLYFVRRKFNRGVEAYQQAFAVDHHIFERSALHGLEALGSREDRATINFYLAETYAQAGMNSVALTYLQKAVNEGFHDEAKLRENKDFAALREMPEFKQLFNKQ